MIKHKKDITPKLFIEKVFAQSKVLEIAKGNIERMERDFVKEYCTYKANQVIKLKEPTEEKYTQFFIEKIRTHIDSVKSNEYNISFLLSGYYMGEFGKGKTGVIRVSLV